MPFLKMKYLSLWLENRFHDLEMELFVFGIWGASNPSTTPAGITGVRRSFRNCRATVLKGPPSWLLSERVSSFALRKSVSGESFEGGRYWLLVGCSMFRKGLGWFSWAVEYGLLVWQVNSPRDIVTRNYGANLLPLPILNRVPFPDSVIPAL